MPHEPGHTNGNTTVYKIYGTDENYNGRVVSFGGEEYTTEGGAYEGHFSRLLVKSSGTSNNQQEPMVQTPTSAPQNNNPVTRTFVSRVVYYREDGSEVPIGSDLHEHQQGQIMLGHDPNNMGAIVTRNRPISSNGNNRQMRTQPRTSTPRQTRTQTSTGGMGGGRTSGGGGY